MKRISLEKLLHSHLNISYDRQYSYIIGLLEEGKIKPLKASGMNGKKPALYREYWLIDREKDDSHLEEELKYRILPIISVDYYLSHLDIYKQDRPFVLGLNEYLKKYRKYLSCRESVNERSFEIWGQEKFLARGQGKRILKRCGLEIDFLNVYTTTEPLAYYSHTRLVPQNVLILENKDTFYSMRRHLLGGKTEILKFPIGTLIYGAGKGILCTFQDFDLCIEPYMKAEGNRIYYFGDLDYEGIGIYENLSEMFWEKWEILPFFPAYDAMMKKAQAAGQLPRMKEGQNRNIQQKFFSYFKPEQVNRMTEILESGRYIPQEILNIMDF